MVQQPKTTWASLVDTMAGLMGRTSNPALEDGCRSCMGNAVLMHWFGVRLWCRDGQL